MENPLENDMEPVGGYRDPMFIFLLLYIYVYIYIYILVAITVALTIAASYSGLCRGVLRASTPTMRAWRSCPWLS